MRYMFIGIMFAVGTALTTINPPNVPDKIPLSEPAPIEKFMDRIAAIETPGLPHTVVNKFGMMGRYQFSPSTVRVLGFKISKKEFLRNRYLQDTVMLHYIVANQRELEPLIKKYDGKIVNGIKITRAGILAGAHFAGSGTVKYFFNSRLSGNGLVDANGTTLRFYMSKFSNFHLPKVVL